MPVPTYMTATRSVMVVSYFLHSTVRGSKAALIAEYVTQASLLHIITLATGMSIEKVLRKMLISILFSSNQFKISIHWTFFLIENIDILRHLLMNLNRTTQHQLKIFRWQRQYWTIVDRTNSIYA